MTKILIIEDDEPILKLYETKLKKEGFDVSVARDGKEGVERAKNMKPNIIILDLMMPIMNGFETIRVLKKDKETKKIPVVFLSNYGEISNITEGMNLGAEDYFIKAEHDPSDIIELVQRVLSQKRPVVGTAFKETDTNL